MKLLTPQQMKAIDETAIRDIGIPGIILMENAAIQTVMKASKMIGDKNDPKVTVVAGTGNNGGDAFAVTRHLLSMGYAVSVFSMTEVENLTGDAGINARILRNMGMDIPVIRDAESLERLKKSCRESHLVIDGLLGTGLNRDVDGILSEVMDVINDNASLILSVDIASGVDGLTGKIRGKCIKADATVTFFLPKIGMLLYPGAGYIGELTVADIGIPYALAEDLDMPCLMEKHDIGEMLPVRPAEGHKGTFGKPLVIAGSPGMTGAAYLSTLAAYRTGSGLVRLLVPENCLATLSVMIPEAVTYGLPQQKEERFSLVKKLIDEADAVLIGPGLSRTEEAMQLLETVVENCDKPMVIDADALNLISGNKSLLERLRCEAIITPHPAEMSRLTGITISGIQDDRIGIAKSFADEFGLTVVLKGAGTVIASNDGRTAINPTGNHGMATAGAGDVLAGVIVSLLGQGLPPYEAAVAGTYIHGLAGDMAAAEMGAAGVMASDIANNISKAIEYCHRDGSSDNILSQGRSF